MNLSFCPNTGLILTTGALVTPDYRPVRWFLAAFWSPSGRFAHAQSKFHIWCGWLKPMFWFSGVLPWWGPNHDRLCHDAHCSPKFSVGYFDGWYDQANSWYYHYWYELGCLCQWDRPSWDQCQPKGQLEAAYSLGIRPKGYALCRHATSHQRIFYQPWGMSLWPLSRTVHSCPLSVSWNSGMGRRQFASTTYITKEPLLFGLPTISWWPVSWHLPSKPMRKKLNKGGKRVSEAIISIKIYKYFWGQWGFKGGLT